MIPGREYSVTPCICIVRVNFADDEVKDTSLIVCRYLLFITYFLHGELYTRTGLQLPTTSYRTPSIIFPPTDHNQLSNIISRHTEYCTIDITLIVGLICASQPYIPNTGPHSYRPLADH